MKSKLVLFNSNKKKTKQNLLSSFRPLSAETDLLRESSRPWSFSGPADFDLFKDLPSLLFIVPKKSLRFLGLPLYSKFCVSFCVVFEVFIVEEEKSPG